jgi:hypothetical protein
MTESISLSEIYSKLSTPAKKLLISMTHFSELGGKRGGILATSGLESEEFNKAAEELKQFNLIETGKLLSEGTEQSFIVGEGDRFRHAPNVQEAVYKDILKIEPIKSEFRKKMSK